MKTSGHTNTSSKNTCGKCKKPKPCACGRPSEYNPGFVHTVASYMDQDSELHWKKQGDVVPSVEGVGRLIGRGKKTLYNWAAANDEFLHALEAVVNEQGRLLQNGGLTGDFNSVITKLMLSANHDMREKSDTTSDGKAVGTVDQLIAAVNAARK